jgi:WD40 repeat protein/tRNA A-37 threonylcarbamoyl transferase component Bud32
MSDARPPDPTPRKKAPGEETLAENRERLEGLVPDQAAVAAPAPALPAYPAHSQFGDYELLSELGRGGMGVVFKARHTRLNRTVALKMIPTGALPDREDLYRFETEAAAAAQLQHPGIVALYEVGAREGQPYFSMEFIQGLNLAQRVAVGGAMPGQVAARYLEATARAVHYAHTRGIIHRDLKPANILLDEHDQPKVADFGLAKLLATDSGQTRTGTVLGTPSYMAPEQAAGSKLIGPASDIYSLGAILYEMLTGRPPFRGETPLATLNQVAELDPMPPRVLNKAVDRDLETICLKCLEKSPGRRYATAADLADDLRRYLDGDPISARRLSAVGWTIRWCRRRPALALLLAACILGPLLFGWWSWRMAEEERNLRQLTELREEAMRHLLYLAQVRQVQQTLHAAEFARAKRLLDGWVPGKFKKDLRDWEWYFLMDKLRAPYSLPGHAEHATAIAYSRDGRFLATAGGDYNRPGEIKIWDAATSKLLHTVTGHVNTIRAVTFSFDSKYLASAGFDHTVKIWDTQRGMLVQTLAGHETEVLGMAFQPGTYLLASAGGDKKICLWAPEEQKNWSLIRSWRAHQGTVEAVAFHPGGDLLATGGDDKLVKLWNVRSGQMVRVFAGHAGRITALAFHPLKPLLAAADGAGARRGEVRLWSVIDGNLAGSYYGLSDRILCLAFDRAGKLAAGSSDGLVHIWDPDRSSDALRFRADTRAVLGLAFSHDDRWLATATSSGRVHVWNSTGGLENARLPGPAQIEAIAFSHDGRLLACAGRTHSQTGEIHVGDAEREKLLAVFKNARTSFLTVAFDRGGRHLAAAGDDQVLRIYDLKQPARDPQLLKGHTGRILAVAFHPEENIIASGGEDETIRLWNAASGKLVQILPADKTGSNGHRNGVLALAFSPDGRSLASGSYDKTVRIWNWATTESRVFKGHAGTINGVAFSPNGRQIASASSDKSIRVWDVASGEDYLKLENLPEKVLSVSFHAHGQRLASVGADNNVRLWDLVTTQEILKLDGPPSARAVAFSPDGRRLACAGSDAAFIWSHGSGEKPWPLEDSKNKN